MSEDHYKGILKEVKDLRIELDDKLSHLEERITAEMKLKHQEIAYKHSDHERRLSLAERILFTTAGVILLGFLGALANAVFK